MGAATSSSRLQPPLEALDFGLHVSQCMLGMVVELPQRRLQGSTPVAALAQQLHLGHHAAQVVPVVPRQALDLVDVLAQVQNLREIREEGDERLLGDGGGGVC